MLTSNRLTTTCRSRFLLCFFAVIAIAIKENWSLHIFMTNRRFLFLELFLINWQGTVSFEMIYCIFLLWYFCRDIMKIILWCNSIQLNWPPNGRQLKKVFPLASSTANIFWNLNYFYSIIIKILILFYVFKFLRNIILIFSSLSSLICAAHNEERVCNQSVNLLCCTRNECPLMNLSLPFFALSRIKIIIYRRFFLHYSMKVECSANEI